MACVSSSEEFVSVTCGIKTYISRLSDNESFCIDHTKLHEMNKCESVSIEDVYKNLNRKPDDTEDIGLSLLCSDFSPCVSRFAFCTLAKILCVVDIRKSSPILLSIHQLSRGASKVKFTPLSKQVVVADKSGDVFLFNPEKRNGDLILGHLSMLLDFLVTPDEQFIITCDRDEKIRVSSFPNAYNIVSYCLGHTEFVSSITLLPHDISYLISTSGDGTVRLWDYKTGSELLVSNIISHLKISEEEEDLSAITDGAALRINDKSSLICVCVAQLNICLVIKFTTDSNGQSVYSVIQEISFQETSPFKISVHSNIVWFLMNCNDIVSVKAMIFNYTSSRFTDSLSENIIKTVNSINSENMTIDFKKNVLRLLFKKKFDNVQEYLKKKGARLSLDEPSSKMIKQYDAIGFLSTLIQGIYHI